MKKVLITGATSMLGLALVNECIENDTSVYAIVRRETARRNRLPKSNLLHVVECNLDELSSLNLDEYGFDAFYHFSWEATNNKSRNIVDAQNRNINYTLDAVRLASRIGSGKFIGAGSQAEYGRVSGSISTDAKVSPDSAYGIAKYAAGRLAGILCDQIGLQFIWTRIFSIYGVGDMSSTMIMYVIAALLKGEKPLLTSCKQQWDYLNCKDAARAFFLVGTKGKSQIYNIGSGATQPLIQYVRLIRDTINKDLPLGIGELPYDSKQVMYLCADIANLIQDTGFKPMIKFEDGISETVDWYKNYVLIGKDGSK